MKNYNWATLGCGVIANELAAALKSRDRNFILLQTVPMKRRLRLPKSTALKRFTTILTSCLKTKMLT